jgi:hypothetical protein
MQYEEFVQQKKLSLGVDMFIVRGSLPGTFQQGHSSARRRKDMRRS